ncbi:hypothetical protein KCMC57_64710 (plasmid) [Kitasatospora sp. CMC57]|uniref:Uncharacterized protein n=1 Tax=Kitasatospora sp. CMC57 TaxID=3231513 RepID=A0AB33KE30_9ACTN
MTATVTTTPGDGPGTLLDPVSGLRSWSGHLVFVGHLEQEEAVRRVLARHPAAQTRFDLGSAFQEHVHLVPCGGALQWLFCRSDAEGALAVTVFFPHRLDEDNDHGDC